MWRLARIIAIISAPSAAWAEPLYPNKPGKKPAEPVTIGARIGPDAGPAPKFVIGASGKVGSGTGDYGFVGTGAAAHEPKGKAEIGYRPEGRFANKSPGS
ncbi:MAG: hypothetical protein AAF401_07040 [Pseudomonadota bacterium]